MHEYKDFDPDTLMSLLNFFGSSLEDSSEELQEKLFWLGEKYPFIDTPSFIESIEEEYFEKYAALYSLWGLILRKCYDQGEAIRKYDLSISLCKKCDSKLIQEVYYNRGYARLETTMDWSTLLDRYENNEEQRHSSINLSPNNKECFQLALDDFTKAYELDPDDTIALENKELCETLLLTLEAQEQLQKESQNVQKAEKAALKKATLGTLISEIWRRLTYPFRKNKK